MNLQFFIDISWILYGYFSIFLFIIGGPSDYNTLYIIKINLIFVIPLKIKENLKKILEIVYDFLKRKKLDLYIKILLNINKIFIYYICYICINLFLFILFKLVKFDIFILDFIVNYAIAQNLDDVNFLSNDIILDNIYNMYPGSKSFFETVLNNSQENSRSNTPRPPENNNTPVHASSSNEDDNSNQGDNTYSDNTAQANAPLTSNNGQNANPSLNNSTTTTTTPAHDWTKMKYFGDPRYHTTGTPAPTIDQVMAKAEQIVANDPTVSGARMAILSIEERNILKNYYFEEAKRPNYLSKADLNNLMNDKYSAVKLKKIIHAIRDIK